MPRLMPTLDEVQRLRPEQRAKIRRFIDQVVREMDDVIERELQRRTRLIECGERIRAHAKALEAQLTPEPEHVTAARRQALLDNTR
ncbi:MAG: hypothetical protein ABFD96_04490 [Armatimonadia bacterium]